MAKPTSVRRGTRDGYWQKRVRSKEFRRALTALIERELQALAGQRIRDIVDPDLVRELIEQSDARLLDREVVADLVLDANRRMDGRLRRRNTSLLDLLDRDLVADIDGILSDSGELSAYTEDLIARMIRQEFVRRLFTDIIFTSIVSFYQRVNPIFGGITMRMMEEQIKGFIRLFMPAVEKQAIAFAIDKRNQRIALDFGRAIVRQLLDEPMRHYVSMASPSQRRKTEALTRRAIVDGKIEAQIRRASLAVWDDTYAAIRNRRIGELVRLREAAGWLAERIVTAVLSGLSRPEVLDFVGAEAALAAAAGQRPAAKGRRRPSPRGAERKAGR